MSTINGGASSGGVFRLNQIGFQQQRTFERLSTGQRINRGADDPAGLIASENLGARVSELDSQIRAMSRENYRLSISEAAVEAANPGAASAVERGEIGIQQRQNESLQRVAETERINTIAARSSIRDADYAKETSALASGGVRQKAAIFAIRASREAQASIIDLLV